MLPLLWLWSGGPMLRCTICCHCFGFEVVPQFENVWFVAVALASKWCPNARRYDLLPLLSSPNAKMYDLRRLLWSRSGAPIQRCSTICCRGFGLEVMLTICCCCCGLEVVPQCWDEPLVAVVLVSKWYPNAKMYVLMPFFWSRSGAPMLRCAICCHCFSVEVAPQFQDVRFVVFA